ncbi:carbon-nitrogen hydrolase [Tuwongella immobilis]|uniref:CN hydrolase domain-containing protein n=1 Tax=Tuwongella immobilis TaxID=692036 RepID=A0A6C2YHM7_9BACT|nr:carbon-nitrogen hydrolase [Tuwongella immobilis]VIP01030.1 nitrilase cyanide hydratase and apolipoprotein n-acyltransferase : Nitrilase/cyanide hydratase and apolipoprotein N-acyltransferase OS=Roseiflexus sp. (strain RS-1) GN=RoseRS_2741 PE=4 SV=1: CN_hydrolase [Tuwongella immobilis]VTR97485.1 nitrilase cyanide hydratase and apolipoprotein n-acyltransferase : Nitrilase/cyanide hydratase and apolipoprotein N-acyltransferase OS=Roseiflexus sp. (strain RS-1) GN=RoseRS_2741 PE=4 SV=1: CN_hydrolas
MPSSSDSFTLGLVQMRMSTEKSANLQAAMQHVRTAAARGAQIICLPELFLTPYFCQSEDCNVFDLAEPIPGETTQQLGALARELKIVLIASLFERRMPGVYHNTAVIFDVTGDIAGIYRKMHIPDDPLYYEKYYFTPGDLGFKAIPTHYAKIGVLVCWDQWYPEGARLTALAGAEVLLYPTAIGWHPKEKAQYGVAQHQAWEISQRGHAVANGIYVAGINRIGHEPSPPGATSPDGIEFWGQTFLSDPQGGIIHRASVDQEEIIVLPCERRKMEDVRRNWPFFRDRRIDAYGEITKRVRD